MRLSRFAAVIGCLLLGQPVYAQQQPFKFFDDFITSRSTATTTLGASDSMPIVQGGQTRKLYPQSYFMRPDASNANAATARANLLPSPLAGGCLVGTGSDWIADLTCSGSVGGMLPSASNAVLPTARTNLGLGTGNSPIFNGLNLERSTAGSTQANILTFKNTGAGDAQTVSIATEDYVGSVRGRIDFITNSLTDFKTGIAFSPGDGSTPVERARFALGTGNFLIGTTTDCSQKLCVQGTVNVTGAVNDAGTAPTGTAGSGYVRADRPTLSGFDIIPPITVNPYIPHFAGFTYGAVGAPFPTDPTYGGSGLTLEMYITPGVGITDAISAGAWFNTHLAAGTKGISAGLVAIAFNDGTWSTDGSTNAGSVGVWTEGRGTRGGALWGLFARAASEGVDIISSAQGIEVDLAITTSVGSKWGVAIVSADYDSGAVTGTTTVAGSFAVIPPSGAIAIINGGIDASGFNYGIFSVMAPGGRQPVAAVGSLWRSGGYTVTHGLDWPDMAFSGNAINLPGFTVDGVGGVTSYRQLTDGVKATFIKLKNTAAGDGAWSGIAAANYSGTDDARIAFITNSLSNLHTGIAFETNTGGGLEERARFALGTGNFLIGTTTDCSQKLCVQGIINVSGSVNDAGAAPTGTAGSGYVRATAPTITNAALVTPTLGVASATSITGLTTPSAASDAVNKAYADSIASGIVTHAAVEAASTANLTATASGTGPGKTLTNSGAQAAFALDGVAGVLNARYGVKDQTLTQNNGIYTLTTVGTGATNWVLTRAADFDAAAGAEVAAGASFIVIAGTANAATQWVETGQGPFTLETTPIVFSKVTSGGGSGTVNSAAINTFGVYASAGSAISGQSFTGLMKGNGASAPGVYGGTSCTNQFPRSLDLNGAATCATVASADLASSLALTTPVISGGSATGLTGLAIRDTSAAFDLTIAATSSPILNAGRILTIDMSNVAHTLDLGSTANTITFPSTASYSVVGTGDTGTVTNTMLAGSIAPTKLLPFAHTQRTVASDAGTTNVTGLMMGLAGTITPTASGNVRISVCGDNKQTAIGSGVNTQLRTGTGAAPAVGAALTGTTRGSLARFVTASVAGKARTCLIYTITGLPLSTAVWIDVGRAAVTSGTATFSDVDIIADEIP